MKKLYIPLICIVICALIFNATTYFYANNSVSGYGENNTKTPVIIIDAGHGGFDGGAVALDGTVEKDINLKISLYLQEYLEISGFGTILTRFNDTSLEDEGLNTIRQRKTSDIHNRLKLMNDTDNALFISIHQNKYHIEKYNGLQVFYSPEFSEQSSELARNIQENVTEILQPDNDRQIKKCGTSVYLIYNAVKPAVLVECGFLSNYEETQLLKTDDYQRKIAFCIATGIQDYVYSKG
ncbi:MAG: N-acetylmuramoyl-L-alanine amidase [Clostridia bacterium]|nr:N-acetylmuramoyl-L-alanine amidase [Clostridia bacterium]